MRKLAAAVGLMLLVQGSVFANCGGEFTLEGPDQFGYVLLFSADHGGPAHEKSRYWAVTGPDDETSLIVMPVILTDETLAEQIYISPRRIAVLADVVRDGNTIWLMIKSFIRNRSEQARLAEEVRKQYPYCGSIFRTDVPNNPLEEDAEGAPQLGR